MVGLSEQDALFNAVALLDKQYLVKQKHLHKTTQATSLISIVRVMINEIEFAVEVGVVVETIVYKKPSRLPRSFDWVLGIIELRGEVIPVIDYSCFTGNDALEVTNHGRLLIVRFEGMVFALMVSSVSGMFNVPKVFSLKNGDSTVKLWVEVNGQEIPFLDLKALLSNDSFLKLTY